MLSKLLILLGVLQLLLYITSTVLGKGTDEMTDT